MGRVGMEGKDFHFLYMFEFSLFFRPGKGKEGGV